MNASSKPQKKSTKTTNKKKAQVTTDEVSLVGSKGGMVKKERQLAHQIDLELRDFTYH